MSVHVIIPYIKFRWCRWLECNTAEPITLKPDVYRYKFTLPLSDELPSSLEGTFGHIRYMCFVTINVPIWPDKIFEKVFTVVRPVNLNEMFELKVSTLKHNRWTSESVEQPEPTNIRFFRFAVGFRISLPHDGIKDSVSFEKRKEFYLCCLLFCFKTLPLNIVAKLPASGFTPGQRIDLTLDIENLSSKNIRNFKVELYKVRMLT